MIDIFLVDSDPSTNEAIFEVIQDEGYRAKCCQTVEDALLALDKVGGARLLITDLRLYGIFPDGVKLATWAKERWPKIQILLMTTGSRSAPLTLERGLEAKVLYKPFQVEALLEEIGALIGPPSHRE
jgi:DNA-binding response OmpR family regulator